MRFGRCVCRGDFQILDVGLETRRADQFGDGQDLVQTRFQMVWRRGEERADAVPADNHSIAFQGHQRIANRVAADAQRVAQLGFAGELIAGLEFALARQSEDLIPCLQVQLRLEHLEMRLQNK